MSQGPDAPRAELVFDRLAEIAVSGNSRVDLCRVTEGPHVGSLVAVKRLHDDVADDPEFVKMFHDEVWMTSALNQENVVRVIGWGESREGPYLGTEFVRGVSLARLMRTVFQTGEMFSERLVVYLCSCISKGMAAAHELRSPAGEFLNLVHRDLTPENVLVGFHGEVKITDFGLAKAKRRASRTITGLVKGAREYMAPEQIEGLPLDRRVDIFALGVMLFELFSGQKPWLAKTGRETMRQILDVPPADLGKLRPGLHSVLVSVVERCLAKDPANRFQSAPELDRELSQWLLIHGYHENQDHLARFVRRNSMRQMRWCEKAIAGEFALGGGPTMAAAPPVTAADEALLGASLLGETDPSSVRTRIDHPTDAGRNEPEPEVAPEVTSSGLLPDGVPMEDTDDASTLIQRPEHARFAVRPRPPQHAPVAEPTTDSCPTLPKGRDGQAPASQRVELKGGGPPLATHLSGGAQPAAPVAPSPAAAAAAGPQSPQGPAPSAIVPAAPKAPSVLTTTSLGMSSTAARPGVVPRPVPTTGRTEPPPPPVLHLPAAHRDNAPSRETQPGPAPAANREAVAVQRQATAIVDDAARVAGRAEAAAERARQAALRARTAADQARTAAERAERAAEAADLARQAIQLASAGNMTEARERLARAERFREASRATEEPEA